MKQRFYITNGRRRFTFKTRALETKNKQEAVRLLEIKRQSVASPGFNQFILKTCLSTQDPLLPIVWTNMVNSVISGNIEKALAYFSSDSVTNYRAMFNSLDQTTLAQNLSDASNLSSFVIDDDVVYAYFTYDLNGKNFAFQVAFENEFGVWKIKDF